MERKLEVGMMIKILSNEINKSMNQRTSEYGITGVQGRILCYVSNSEKDLFQKDIEACLFYRRSTVTGILNTMEENGLIKRVSVDYDARLKKIVITDKGKCIESKIAKDIKNMEETLKQGLTEEELNIFFNIADKMMNSLK